MLLGVAGAVQAAAGRVVARGATQVATREVAETVLYNATKSEARQAAAAMHLPVGQARAVGSAISRATAREAIDIIAQANGNVMVHLTRPGHDGFQLFQSIVAPSGAKNVTQYGVEATGRFLADIKVIGF